MTTESLKARIGHVAESNGGSRMAHILEEFLNRITSLEREVAELKADKASRETAKSPYDTSTGGLPQLRRRKNGG